MGNSGGGSGSEVKIEKPSPDLPGLDMVDNNKSNRPAMDQLIESASDIISGFNKVGGNGNGLTTLVSGLLNGLSNKTLH
jgi:hypothetical protein